MSHNKLYEQWCKNAVEDKDLTAELESINGNDEEIFERFYRSLEFGTAGLRGIIGAGTNRMNIYVVRQATQGLADYVLNKYGKGAVAISHDSRIKADLFIDDRSVTGLPDWGVIYQLISQKISYEDYLHQKLTGEAPRKKRKWWF